MVWVIFLTFSISASNWWLPNIPKRGEAVFANKDNYQVFRNVLDYGAKGDGVTDDTEAINNAISDGGRCGKGCDETTVTPAIIYFPPGTYLVSRPIIPYYYTQLIGDAIDPPTLKASNDFNGMAVIDANPYGDGGNNWWVNQDNFWRQVRNFIIDLRGMNEDSGTGIHWQVSQATSLQNIVFNMHAGSESGQQGIFIENGSGGFINDLVFNGGKLGAFFGNQQFTMRGLTFNNCKTGAQLIWNWAWNFKSAKFTNCDTGLDISQNDEGSPQIGSVIVVDSSFINNNIGIKTVQGPETTPISAGTLVVDNCDFRGTKVAIQRTSDGATLVDGGNIIDLYLQGQVYTSDSPTDGNGNARGTRVQGESPYPISRPAILVDEEGKYAERSKPQYEEVPLSSFVSVKANGARGDGVTDDTQALQSIFDSAGSGDIIFFDHGAYIVSNTIYIKAGIRITGEIWPLIIADGSAFQDESNPIPVLQVGNAGETGTVEISDIDITCRGPQPGAILLQWNLKAPDNQKTKNGLWDTHFRIGGSAGTNLESDHCAKHPDAVPSDQKLHDCTAAFLTLHITKTASCYLENCWLWVSDHEMDNGGGQIDIFNGRGLLIESQGPVWAYGTSSEHHQLYNYNIAGAKNIYLGLIQTETPYYQSNPTTLLPFKTNSNFNDPTYSDCGDNKLCQKAWGLFIVDSRDIYLYGGGSYSFFENYGQDCLDTESCQTNMVGVYGECSNIWLFLVSTKASDSVVTYANGAKIIPQGDNRATFCSTVALFLQF